MRVIRPDTADQRESLLAGRVRAERVNDVIAAPDSKRFLEYRALIEAQAAGEPELDPADAHRLDDDRLHLVARALDAYRHRHPGEKLTTGCIYLHDDYPLACVPDAMSPGIGITVHVCRSLKTYQDAIATPITADQRRKAWAMTAVTECAGWILLDYFEDAETATRKLTEREIFLDRGRAADLLEAMIGFARAAGLEEAA